MAAPIRMSVVVVWRDARERVGDCLRSLCPQVSEAGGEVIVVSALSEQATQGAAAEAPQVRWVHLEPPLTEPRAWEAGARAARGAIIAFAQARCQYAAGWAQAALASCETHDSAEAPALVSGPVLPEPGMPLPARAAYLCDYAQFADPAGQGGGRAASNNLALARETLLNESARQGAGRGLDKAALVLGGRWQIVWSPAMLARTRMVRSFWADTRARFARGRHFASLRARHWPAALRLAAGAGCFALPILLYARMILNRFVRVQYAATLALGLPWLAFALCGWSLGELAGYWAGPGASERGL